MSDYEHDQIVKPTSNPKLKTFSGNEKSAEGNKQEKDPPKNEDQTGAKVKLNK